MDTTEALTALRAPFRADQIGKLPRGGTTLDFVGHGHVTARLLDVDPEWSWEPLAADDHGLPYIDYSQTDAALWIRLTVCGVTRLGVGTAKTNSVDLVKQLIGDAIRNAAMRFGVALDLWARGDTEAGATLPTPPAPIDTAYTDTYLRLASLAASAPAILDATDDQIAHTINHHLRRHHHPALWTDTTTVAALADAGIAAATLAEIADLLETKMQTIEDTQPAAGPDTETPQALWADEPPF